MSAKRNGYYVSAKVWHDIRQRIFGVHAIPTVCPLLDKCRINNRVCIDHQCEYLLTK